MPEIYGEKLRSEDEIKNINLRKQKTVNSNLILLSVQCLFSFMKKNS